MNVTDERGVFRQQLGRLLSNYGLSDPARIEPIALNFTDAALREEWESDLFEATCRWVAWHIDPPFPGLSKFREVYRVLKAERDAQESAESLALPAPRPVTEEIDPSDPYSSTPEERQRWAREDSWLRSYALTLPKEPPDGDQARDSWERNWSVANWVTLRPDQRRAKERRIAGEKAQAMAVMRAAAAAQRARREAALAARQAESPPPTSDVREIVWNDGVISRVKVSPAAGEWPR